MHVHYITHHTPAIHHIPLKLHVQSKLYTPEYFTDKEQYHLSYCRFNSLDAEGFSFALIPQLRGTLNWNEEMFIR